VVPPRIRSGEVSVFLLFCFGFVIIGASRRIPRIWPVGMADVGGSPVELCFIARSTSLG